MIISNVILTTLYYLPEFLYNLPLFLKPGPEWRTDVIIKNHGYPVEVHQVETTDGYVLQMHRIPPKNNTLKRSILLLHGIAAYSSIWVASPRNISLAYTLSDAGYDVWLGNVRTTPHSNKHKTFDPESEQFWNYSLEEMAVYDLPAMIDYILNETNSKKIYYVGHSMGTTLGFILLSTRLEYNKKIQLFIAESPSVFLSPENKLPSFLKTAVSILLAAYKLLGFYSCPLLWPKFNLNDFCIDHWLTCRQIMDEVNGANHKQWSKEVIADLSAQSGTPYSIRAYEHYIQIIVDEKFQRYDWGSETNYDVYGQHDPPEYPVELITAPTVFYSGLNDKINLYKDALILASRLPYHKATIIVSDSEWTHFDYIVANNASIQVNYPIIKLIDDLACYSITHPWNALSFL